MPDILPKNLHLLFLSQLLRLLFLWQRLGAALDRRLRRAFIAFTADSAGQSREAVNAAGVRVLDAESKILTQALKKWGEGACWVADVGARWGGAKAWWDLAPLANHLGFEPDAKECDRLNAISGKHARYVPVGLGARSGRADLYITQAPACSSLYPPNQQLPKRYPDLSSIKLAKQETISVARLDDWWDREKRPWVAFLKIDTQGSELDILKGGVSCLGGAVGVEVEVEFSPLYVGQPLFADVDAFLRLQGFHLWAMHEQCSYSEDPSKERAWHSSRFRPAGNGRLFWCSAVYFRDYQSWQDWCPNDREKKLFMLGAFLEAAGDKVAAENCMRLASPA